MPTAITLSQMADLALGTPELGSVNFNVMHTLFHAILAKLDIANAKADVNDEDKEFLTRRRDVDQYSDKDSAITDLTDRPITATDSKNPVPLLHTPYHEMEKKVAKLQEQMDRLNALPSNNELMERSRGEGERPRPVSDMWQGMQLKNRVDANEDGISKLMSLVEDMMKEIANLKDENENLKKFMNDKNQLEDILKRLEELENLQQQLKNLQDQVNGLPTADMFDDFVTWSALEDSMKGLRQELDPKERVVIEMTTQTTPSQSRPQSSSKGSSRPGSRRSSTPGPSNELLDILEKLGTLTDRHDKLEGRVDELEKALANKADKGALEGLGGVPEDLLDQLKHLQEQIDELDKLKNRKEVQIREVASTMIQADMPRKKSVDADALARLQTALHNLQSELERIASICNHLVDENNKRVGEVESLVRSTKVLDETKADKGYVDGELDGKADKSQLDGKVSRSLFDSTVEELNKLINDILAKLESQEEEWRKALEQLSNDLDGKLDRLEFGPIRDEIERQLRALMRKLNTLQPPQQEGDDDAAGIRKQLIQRFHCISCDRPVEMMPQGPIPSIPAPAAMPASRSSRPYTTFELEQIRQHAKGDGLPPLIPGYNGPQSTEIMDLYAHARACGGSHTLTFPQRRQTRAAHVNNFFVEEATPAYKEELDIQGADGHIYRGRVEKLPNLTPNPPPHSKGSPKGPRRAKTVIGLEHRESSSSPRPGSARQPRMDPGENTQRPNSVQGGGVRMPPNADEVAEESAPVPSVSQQDFTQQ